VDNHNNSYLIHFDQVEVSYPLNRRQTRCVLRGINLHVTFGEFVTIVGPTGCGKSTMLRMILGSQFPTNGQVLVDGKPVIGVGRDRGIVFQKYSLFPNLTVLENIAFGRIVEQTTLPQRLIYSSSFRRLCRQAREEARAFVDRIDLSAGDVDKYPFELSGGMRQRVALAQALIMCPKILLMDEPFGALDPSTREEMQLLILEQWKQFKMTILFVTHDLEEAAFLATRLIAISQYWSDDSGKKAEFAQIVYDKVIPGGHPKPTSFKESDVCNQIMAFVRRDALDPDYCQRRNQFDLTHQDAWNPLTGNITCEEASKHGQP